MQSDSYRPDSVGLPSARLLRGIMLMLSVLLAVTLLVLPVMILSGASNGIASALAALALCFVCGTASLTVMHFCSRQGNGLVGALLSMAIRMFPPLAVCLVLAAGDFSFSSVPFVGSLLAYYFAMLAVDVWLATQTINQSPVNPVQQATESA